MRSTDYARRIVAETYMGVVDNIDAAVDRTLAEAREGKSPVFSTRETIRQGEEMMAQARIDAAHYLADCVKCVELIPLVMFFEYRAYKFI